VLILEDDAEVLAAATGADFAAVDLFLARHVVDAYTLGSTGPRRPSPHPGHHRIQLQGFAHAVVWSEAARAWLFEAYLPQLAHIDGDFLARLPLIYAFHAPLVGQRVHRTAISYEWTVLHLGEACRARGGPVVWLDRALVRVHVWMLQWRYGLARDTAGWADLYRDALHATAVADQGASVAQCVALVRLAAMLGASCRSAPVLVSSNRSLSA